MNVRLALVLAAVAIVAACQPGPNRPWLKPGPYTSAEFKRDTEACTRHGDLDSACMEARGWIAVQPEKEVEKKKERPTYNTPRQ
jgi:hypothetical protein